MNLQHQSRKLIFYSMVIFSLFHQTIFIYSISDLKQLNFNGQIKSMTYRIFLPHQNIPFYEFQGEFNIKGYMTEYRIKYSGSPPIQVSVIYNLNGKKTKEIHSENKQIIKNVFFTYEKDLIIKEEHRTIENQPLCFVEYQYNDKQYILTKITRSLNQEVIEKVSTLFNPLNHKIQETLEKQGVKEKVTFFANDQYGNPIELKTILSKNNQEFLK